jgi:hypothetical protein
MHRLLNYRLLRIHPISRAAGLAVLALCAAPAATADTLVVNGKTASVAVRTYDGSAYVRFSDMAKALGMILVKRPGGYELTKAGGTDQVQAMTQGKVGDVLFDGYWRFQVQSVEMTDSYAVKKNGDGLSFDRSTNVLHAGPRTKLVVIRCRMTNGQKSVQTFWLAPLPGERAINNALTDTEGESYPPDGYDLDGTTSQSKPLLPGAKTDFVILFSVPETVQRKDLKDLVFTLQNNDSRRGNDVRVSLMP